MGACKGGDDGVAKPRRAELPVQRFGAKHPAELTQAPSGSAPLRSTAMTSFFLLAQSISLLHSRLSSATPLSSHFLRYLSFLSLLNPSFASGFLPAIVPMASSSRIAGAALRRARCSPAPLQRAARLRPATQVRWTGSTSATSEPHQPDSKGSVKSKPAPAKTVKFTSESYIFPLPDRRRIYN